MPTNQNRKGVGRRLLAAALLCAATALGAQAQQERISLSARNVTVKELLNRIESKSNYTFAYADEKIPLNKRVTVEAKDRSIASILSEVLPDTQVKVENRKIVLTAAARQARTTTAAGQENENSASKEKKGWVCNGTVVDSQGEPVIGANVTQKGHSTGVMTNTDGQFTLRVVGKNPVISIRYIGYATQEVTPKKGAPLKVVMKDQNVALDEVVVTALGITREQKSLGYAVTKIDNEDLTNTVSGNWLSNMSGKVAGLTMSGAGTGPSSSLRVVLRGDQSLNYGANEALFVVDGVPIYSGDSGTSSENSLSTDAPVDFGNAASEINPEDVESVSVLKGPAATALYGSRAANGAIVITTKSGRKEKGLGVTINSSITWERAMRLPDFQTEYGPGSDMGFNEFSCWNFSKLPRPEGFNEGSRNASRYAFGEKFDPNKLRNQYNSYNWETGEFTMTPFVYADDWYSGLFETGVTYKNNATISTNNGKGTSARLSVTDTRNNWILPNTGYENQTVSFAFNTKMNKWIKFNAKANYLHKASDNTPPQGYNKSNPLYFLMWSLNNISMKEFKEEYFAGRCTKENFESNLVDGKGMANRLGNSEPGNVYRSLYEATNSINKDRVYGNVALNITFPVKGLTLDLRAGTDISVDWRQQKKPFRSPGYKSGFYRELNNRDNETNIDFLLRYNNTFFQKRFSLNAAFGGNTMIRRAFRNSITLNNLGEEDVYNTTNTAVGENPRNYNWRSRKTVNSFYGFVNLSWDNTYFLDLTARNDWSSALGRGNWSFFYPSVSASVLLDKVFKFEEKAQWIDMLKVRGSWANVGNDTSPYTLTDSYTASGTYPGSYQLPSGLANYYIKPENIESYEFGIETMMFRNRFGFDIAYYNSSTTNQIINATMDYITGSSSRRMNCGEIRNQGIEIAVHATPVRTRDFSWQIDFNWSRNWNKLVSLEDGWNPETPYWTAQGGAGNNAFIYSFIGEEMNWIYGLGYVRAPEGSTYTDANGNTVDCSGQIIIDPSNGYPIKDSGAPHRIAKVNPTWQAGLSTSFRYKNFNLGLTFAAQVGGHAYSTTHGVLAYQGKLKNSLPGRYEGLVVAGVNRIDNGDGTYTYQPNQTITESVYTYYNQYKFIRTNAEENTFSTDFLKLKEARLDYTLPQKICRKLRVLQGAQFGIYATNIFCITDFPQYDPEAGTMIGTNIYNGIEAGSLPMTRTWGINLKLSF